jgi:sarcosine oxidase
VERFPVGMRRSGGSLDFSFFPAVDPMGIKVNFHVPKDKIASMVDAPESVPAGYSERVSPGITTTFNGVSSRWSGAKSFIDAYTKDKQPVFARLDSGRRCLAMAGFSGQGFKMAPAFARLALFARQLTIQPYVLFTRKSHS